jgi:serine protease Do
MNTYPAFKSVLYLLILAALVLGCSPGIPVGSGQEGARETPIPATNIASAAPAATATRVSSLEAAQAGTVQITAEGNEFLGSGSGFIYDSQGLIITNNHVVEGAAILKVYLEGSNEPLPVRVLGKSPCDDLAVLRITTEGQAYPSVPLGQSVSNGEKVFAIGYPLGDPVQSMTSGIISKTEADGDSYFVSLPRALQTDAAVNPGNSGGPLVNERGEVIGVIFSGVSADVAQGTNFAIPMDYAEPIIKQLEAGNSLHWVGLNLMPLTAEAAEYFQVAIEPGLFVLGVDSGSPADKAGLQPGDFITAVEGVQVGVDGMLKTYCDILRSHDTKAVLNVAATRGQARCNGQLNGDKLVCQEVAVGGESTVSGAMITVTDASGRISLQAPEFWETSWDMNFIVSSPDLNAWQASYGALQEGAATTPGFFFYLIDSASGAALGLPEFSAVDDAYIEELSGSLGSPANCDAASREESAYDDGVYLGKLNVTGCDDGSAAYIQLMTYNPQDPTYLIWLEGFARSEEDLSIITNVLTTFFVAE